MGSSASVWWYGFDNVREMLKTMPRFNTKKQMDPLVVSKVGTVGCLVTSKKTYVHWPFQVHESEGPTKKTRPIFQGVPNMVHYLHFRVLKFPLKCVSLSLNVWHVVNLSSMLEHLATMHSWDQLGPTRTWKFMKSQCSWYVVHINTH
jgi:hypothetical protein